MRTERGDVSLGNHLVLRVDLDRPYIADVGFGDGVVEPFPLAFGAHHCAGYEFRLEDLGDTWLRFHNQDQGGAPYFDFQLEPAEADQLSATCQWLASSPDSIFTQTALGFGHTPKGIVGLLGRTIRRVRPGAKTSEVIDSADEFVVALHREFDLDIPEAAELWPAICAKHAQIFGESSGA